MNKDKEYYKQLDMFAKAFYNLSVREGPIEDYHAEGCLIGDKEMEKINRFGVNRLGYISRLEKKIIEKLRVELDSQFVLDFS